MRLKIPFFHFWRNVQSFFCKMSPFFSSGTTVDPYLPSFTEHAISQSDSQSWHLLHLSEKCTWWKRAFHKYLWLHSILIKTWGLIYVCYICFLLQCNCILSQLYCTNDIRETVNTFNVLLRSYNDDRKEKIVAIEKN